MYFAYLLEGSKNNQVYFDIKIIFIFWWLISSDLQCDDDKDLET